MRITPYSGIEKFEYKEAIDRVYTRQDFVGQRLNILLTFKNAAYIESKSRVRYAYKNEVGYFIRSAGHNWYLDETTTLTIDTIIRETKKLLDKS